MPTKKRGTELMKLMIGLNGVREDLFLEKKMSRIHPLEIFLIMVFQLVLIEYMKTIET